jgi:hypothetical protein
VIRPPTPVTAAIDAVADAIEFGRPLPPLPQPSGDSPGARALHAALTEAAAIVSGRKPPARDPLPSRQPEQRERIRDVVAAMTGGRFTQQYALRLMASIGVCPPAGHVRRRTR